MKQKKRKLFHPKKGEGEEGLTTSSLSALKSIAFSQTGTGATLTIKGCRQR
jgi:hypothetical protein